MRVRKLNLKNVGPFEDAEIEFKPTGGTQEIHILTGPNGSGKTTLLQSLAIFFGASVQNMDALLKRMWASNSSEISLIVEGDGLTLPAFTVDRSRLIRAIDPSPFKSIPLSELPYLPEYARNGGEHWLPFAYNGYRVARSIHVNAIQEFDYGSWQTAFSEAITFDKQSMAKDNKFVLNQWIANNISKRALSKEKGKVKEASKYNSAINLLEEIISKIIGYPIELDLRTSPLSLVIKSYEKELEFDVLPDGLRSTISWMGDLLMRLDSFDTLRTDTPLWNNELPINKQRIFLFLDEIDVHLHPKWQRNILPVVKEFFPNATIFLTTHSPFVVNSVDGAWVYELKVTDGKAYLGEVTESKSSISYRSVLREVFDIEKPFGGETQEELDKFQQQREQILRGQSINEKQFLQRARKLAKQSEELLGIISLEIRQINHIKGTNYEL
jgi:predicted ATP-binding protein involved in virulence